MAQSTMTQPPHPIPAVKTGNRYSDDPPLRALLRRHLPPATLSLAEPWLEEMGELSAGPVDDLAFQADANPPVLERYDQRGDRVDRVVFHPAYHELERLSFGRGVIGRFYDPETRARLGPHCSQVKFALGYLFTQAEQGVYCPVAMTDGAAQLLERHADAPLREQYLPRLTSTRLERLYQGAMYLTEREGGSDVGATTTVARSCTPSGANAARAGGPGERGAYRITGEKWFCSNAGAEVMMVMARVEQADGRTIPGTRGLGLFLVPRTLEDGSLNALRIRRLKNKLGTRSMATGEASLRGAIGFPVGPLDRGFLAMTEMLNLCRQYNSMAALGVTRRVLWEAAAHVAQRQAFGRTVDSYGLVQELLSELFAELEGSLEVMFSVAGDADAFDNGPADEEIRGCLRLMTPLLKLNTARLSVRAASEAIELLGGIGYLEDCVTARFFRDAQVLPVWEGTKNIMYLDALRWITKEHAHRAVLKRIGRLLDQARHPLAEKAAAKSAALAEELEELARLSPEVAPLVCRRLCDVLYPLYTTARLLPAAGNSPRLAAVVRLLAQKLGLEEPADSVLPDAYRLIVREAVKPGA